MRSVSNRKTGPSQPHKTMPLPSVANGHTAQCTARSKRSRARCLNPAAFGMSVCRFHGAGREETIRRGHDHPAYKHGRETLDMKAERSLSAGRLRALEELMHLLKMTTDARTPGRKPATQPLRRRR